MQQAAELTIAAPTITASLDGRYMSALKDQRVAAAELFTGLGLHAPSVPSGIDKAKLIEEVKQALYCSKVCSYAQGMNIIKAKSEEKNWGIDLGELSRIWKVGGPPFISMQGGCVSGACVIVNIQSQDTMRCSWRLSAITKVGNLSLQRQCCSPCCMCFKE